MDNPIEMDDLGVPSSWETLGHRRLAASAETVQTTGLGIFHRRYWYKPAKNIVDIYMNIRKYMLIHIWIY